MELITNIVFTVVAVLLVVKFLVWTWTSHIDLKATFRKFVNQQPKITDTVITRDLNKLYQNGVTVADVTGPRRPIRPQWHSG